MEDFFTDKTYTVEEIDQMVKEFIELKNETKNFEDKVKALKSDMAEAQENIIKALEENTKDNWTVPGFKLSLKTEKYPKLEKDLEKFQELEKYLKEVGGDDLYYSYATINHQSLRSLVKYLQEVRPEDTIPAVDLSFERKSLSLRKAK